MIYRASNTRNFLSMPETGMGYQIIQARIPGYLSWSKYVVYNGELIVDLDRRFNANRKQIILEGYSSVLRNAGFLNLENLSLAAEEPFLFERRSLSENERKIKNRNSGGKGAEEGQKESANGVDVFVRLSAYENDIRIDLVRGRLVNGSYATTKEDYLLCVLSGDNPIDRYALPNDEEIQWAFYILPRYGDTLQKGIVQPKFERSGGGVEAYFENGTSDKTYQGRRKYGE